jgi:molybdate transport system substrate-binding protein
MLRRAFLGALLTSPVVACTKPDDAPRTLKIAAAADLAVAFKEVGEAFEKLRGVKSIFTFGSTGLLSKQVVEGAPFDVFAAANVSFIEDLATNGHVLPETKTLYARGRIVVWTKATKLTLAGLTDDAVQKIAIANPEHAPYGRAAEQALRSVGVYDRVKPKLVFGENVQQALQFAESGNADVAVVALSLAMHAKGQYEIVDEALHEPIAQAMAVCSISKLREDALAFVRFVEAPEGRAIMTSHGFLLPGETLAATRDSR